MSSTNTTLRLSYYLEINGRPCCVSNVHPKTSPPFACGHGTDLAKAKEHRRRVLRDHPNAVVVIRGGGCPARALEEGWRESPDALDHAKEWTAELVAGGPARLAPLDDDKPRSVTFLGLLVERNGDVSAIVQFPDRDLLESVHFSRVRPPQETASEPIGSPEVGNP